MEMHNSHSENSHLSNDLVYQTKNSTSPKGSDNITFDSTDIDNLMTLFMNNPATRQLAKKVVQYNGVAVLGALAYKAQENWHSNKPLSDVAAINNHDVYQASPIPDFTHTHGKTEESLLAESLMKAMIATASTSAEFADHCEESITAAQHLGFDDEKIAFMNDVINSHVTPEDIARCVNLDKQKSEVYIAAYLASSGDNEAEGRFLTKLASAMDLPQGLTTYLEHQADLGIA